MNSSGGIRPQMVLWGLILGLWALLVLAFAGQLFFVGNVPWSQAAMISLRDWYPWLLLGPIVVWLALRFPLELNRLKISIPVHLVGCVAAVVIYSLLTPRPPPGRGFGMGGQFRFRGGIPEQNVPPGPEQRPQPPRDQRPPFPPEEPSSEPRSIRPPAFPSERSPGVTHIPDSRAIFLNRTAMHARFNVPIYWVIVSVAHALTYYRRSQDRERRALELESRLSEAKLHSLRMQLHPHFLFNTLNAVSMLVHKDPNAADEMIGNLSELLRATLDTTQQEITLRQELEFLDRYLEIQQVRFGDRLRVERQIDASALSGRVPPLILQPLVENAIRHGIEPQPEPGVVRVQVGVKNQMLELEIWDNGQGLKQGLKQPEGIGLANTRARLQALYGSSATLVLQSGGNGGCTVRLQIPYRDHDADTHSR